MSDDINYGDFDNVIEVLNIHRDMTVDFLECSDEVSERDAKQIVKEVDIAIQRFTDKMNKIQGEISQIIN